MANARFEEIVEFIPLNNLHRAVEDDRIINNDEPDLYYSEVQIEQILLELETKERVFDAFDLLDNDIHGNGEIQIEILKFIDKHITLALGCRLVELKDKKLVDLICATYFNSDDIDAKWTKCQEPLMAGLIIVYIYRCMRREFKRVHENQIEEFCEQKQMHYDELCENLLDKCSKDNFVEMRCSLESDYRPLIMRDRVKAPFLELMHVANMGKARRFLANRCCQRAIEWRWQPGFKIGSLWFYISMVTLWLQVCVGGRNYRLKRREDPLRNWDPQTTRGFVKSRLYSFYTCPNSKYAIHMLVRFIYVAYYGYILLSTTRQAVNRHRMSVQSANELAIYAWQATFLVEMVVQVLQMGIPTWRQHKHNCLVNIFCVIKQGFILWHPHNHGDFIRNIVVICNIFFLSLSFIGAVPLNLRVFTLPLADCFFYLSFVMASVRSLKLLNVDVFFGSIVLMIKKMSLLMFKFLGVFGLFWLTYAICHISLANHYNGLQTTPWKLFQSGAFEIFGEAEDDDKKGTVKNCSSFDWDDITDSSVMCLFKTTMIPLLLFIYMLVASVLLINLVTAMLTKKFDDISKYSHIYWKYKRYERLTRYEEKLWLPPPLSIFYYLFFLISLIPFCCGWLRSMLHQFQGEKFTGLDDVQKRDKEAMAKYREKSRQIQQSTIAKIVKKSKSPDGQVSHEEFLPLIVLLLLIWKW